MLSSGSGRPRLGSALAIVAALAVVAAPCLAVLSFSSPAPAATRSNTPRAILAYAQCMQTHGDPSFPTPSPTGDSGVHLHVVTAPNSPVARANAECEHLLPNPATGSPGSAATPASSPSAVAADCLITSDCYSPRLFRVAYGIQPLLERGITGRGVSVVLPEEAQTGPVRLEPATKLLQAVTDIRQDLTDFDHRFGLPPARIQVITTLAGSSASPWLAGVEEVEDTELVHAVAPGATIRELLVNPADVSTPANLATTFATYVAIASSKGEVMSQSGIGQNFNVGEDSWTAAEVAIMNSALQDAAKRKLTVVVASGDYGAIGNGSSTPLRDVSLPGSDPLVLSAGGTTLTANRVTGAYVSETAWNIPGEVAANGGGASGGGFSHLFARPAYQNGVPGIGADRGVPDVAGDASDGMALAFSAPGGGDDIVGGGGTSAAAPFWAGLIALADQEAGHALGFVNPAIYRIARSPLYDKAFHQITTGNNTVVLNGVPITGYQAGPGWNPVTGWGTPDAAVLIPLLARDASQ